MEWSADDLSLATQVLPSADPNGIAAWSTCSNSRNGNRDIEQIVSGIGLGSAPAAATADNKSAQTSNALADRKHCIGFSVAPIF